MSTTLGNLNDERHGQRKICQLIETFGGEYGSSVADCNVALCIFKTNLIALLGVADVDCPGLEKKKHFNISAAQIYIAKASAISSSSFYSAKSTYRSFDFEAPTSKADLH